MNYHRSTKIAFSLFLICTPFVSGCSQISNPDINNQIGFIVCDSTKIQEEEEDKSINPKQIHKGEIWFALNRRTSELYSYDLNNDSFIPYNYWSVKDFSRIGEERVNRLFKVTSEIKGNILTVKDKELVPKDSSHEIINTPLLATTRIDLSSMIGSVDYEDSSLLDLSLKCDLKNEEEISFKVSGRNKFLFTLFNLRDIESDLSKKNVKDISSKDIKQMYSLVGGVKKYKNLMSWASSNLSEQEISQFDNIISKGNLNQIELAIKRLNKYYLYSISK